MLTRVQGTGKVTATATSLAATFAAPPAVGSAVLVLVHEWFATTPGFAPGGCVDTAGNAYTLAVTRNNPTRAIAAAVYVCLRVTATAAPFTVTVSPSTATGSHKLTGALVEIASGGAGLALDQTASDASLSASGLHNSGGTGLLTADDIVFAAVMAMHVAETTLIVKAVTPAWDEEYEELDLTTHAPGEGNLRFRTGALGGTDSTFWNVSPTFGYSVAVLAAFKAGAVIPAVLAGELDRRTLTTATGPLNATWTGTASAHWVAGLVALKAT